MVRFDKPCCRVSGAVEYFREHMEIGDYLEEHGKSEMTWFGQGAENLGLRGRCRREQFERLCQGRHPDTGERLTARDRGAGRRVCFFGQISPPKDVSIACLVGGDERIRRWWAEAVRETLHEIEAVTATRVRRSGEDTDRRTGNMVAAIVTHEASRKLDPQLHTHVCIMNATFDATESRWKSVQPAGYYRHQGFLREVCYARLAARLRAAGYEIESVRGIGFALKGVPPELRERFSQRRAEIRQTAARIGAVSQDALQAIAGESRDAKANTTAAELRADWLKSAGQELPALREVIALADGQPFPAVPITAEAALTDAEAHLYERRSVVDRRELLAEALAIGRGDVTLADLRSELDGRIASGALIASDDELASRAGLEAEEEFVHWANGNRDTCPPLGDAGPYQLGQDEQSRAVVTLLASRSRVTLLQGDAGTGKTTCLRAVVTGIERAGGSVFGCTPSSGAAEVLRRELTPRADTLQQLLVNPALQAALRGRVVLVDEAGLVSVRQLRDLCRLARDRDCRLLLVGDTKQHTSVEAGDALRCLQRYGRVPVAHLTTIRRQRDSRWRDAVRFLARGHVTRAFAAFQRLGGVHELRTERDLFRVAADDYLRTIRSGQSCLVIAPVWSDIHVFATEARARLRSASLLRGSDHLVPIVHPLQWTSAQMRRPGSYQPGDVLSFHRASAGFAKGEHATVVRRETGRLVVRRDSGAEVTFDPRKTGGFDVGTARELPVAVGDRLLLRRNVPSLRLKNGDLVAVAGFTSRSEIRLAGGGILPADFRHFTHGYATTSHAAQGRTVDRGLLLLTEAGLAAANLKQCYVSNSRFRESQAIYTTDAGAARAALQRPADRRLASELAEPDARTGFRMMLLHRLSRLRSAIPSLAALRGWADSLARIARATPTRA